MTEIKNYVDEIESLKNINISSPDTISDFDQSSNPEIKTLLSKYKISSFVVNLDSRPDRLETVKKCCPIPFTRFPAINGKSLKYTEQLEKIFQGNWFGMRRGVVGCALSHIKLFIDLINSPDDTIYLIMEDDITFDPDFTKKFKSVLEELGNIRWDLIYLGHHFSKLEYYNFDKKAHVKLEKWTYDISAEKSYGGLFGFLINKKGALKFLDFINKLGVIYPIDSMQQQSIAHNIMDTYYCTPHLIYSECVRGDNGVNSDIQRDFILIQKSDFIPSGEYQNRLMKNGKFDINDSLVYV